MGLTSSAEAAALPRELQDALLEIARQSIVHGVERHLPLQVDPLAHPEMLRRRQATFVTLRIAGGLRGCMGSLEATEPLAVNVARNAFSAAFRDPRFPPVSADELPKTAIHISLLSDPQPIDFESEAELLRQIRPGVDGLILVEGSHRGTLLPAVWHHLKSPRDFLAQLKQKAGLAAGYWSSTIRVQRYTAESIGPDE